MGSILACSTANLDLLKVRRHMCPINPLFCTLRVPLWFFFMKFILVLIFFGFVFAFELHLTESEFKKVQMLISVGQSWVDVGVQICQDPEKLRKYFRRFRTKTNLIYSQQSDYHGVEWNRPSQMWLVRLNGVFIGRFSEESRAALVVDSIFADLFPHATKVLPRNFARKKSRLYKRTLATVKNWKHKKCLLRRVTFTDFSAFFLFACFEAVK